MHQETRIKKKETRNDNHINKEINKEQSTGTRNDKRETRNKEKGKGNKKQDTRHEEQGTWNKEQGTRNKERGTVAGVLFHLYLSRLFLRWGSPAELAFIWFHHSSSLRKPAEKEARKNVAMKSDGLLV